MSNSQVRLTHYDPKWRQEFEQTRSSIFSCSEGWVTDVYHIGSTAIPGLIARPTVDVVATAANDNDLSLAIDLIAGLNFRTVETPLWADGATMMTKPRQETAQSPHLTHRLFLVVHAPERDESTTLRRSLAVRDYLLASPESAVEFEEFKVNAWKEYQGDLAGYQTAKSRFFAETFDRLQNDQDG